jgi:hypothetical protein
MTAVSGHDRATMLALAHSRPAFEAPPVFAHFTRVRSNHRVEPTAVNSHGTIRGICRRGSREWR